MEMPNPYPAFDNTWGFSAYLRDPRSRLLVEQPDVLRRAFRIARHTRPFVLHAIVVLPSQLHGVWTLPPGDEEGESRWRQIQAVFDRQLPGQPPRALLRRDRCARPLWQADFPQQRIVDAAALQQHIAWVHHCPVQQGHVREPAQWPYSSIHRRRRHGAGVE
ncbi:transposase [Stenotrophomonas sp. PS02289]|uniref:REP-associated tyrosine transposase n=1 Tax=Stenotrophomonas sp. PS02289 TaxID=2991422 RepID=UPI002499E526|nr:transposase [Stenotrophomonas sp. PS02289]